LKKIRIIVIEDNRLLREGITVMLKEQSDMAVVASLSNGDALARRPRLNADIVLLDLMLRSRNNLQFVESIRAKSPRSKVIIMDLSPDQPTLIDYVRTGVSGFVLKDATLREFLHTIREVARGSKVLPPMLTSSLLSQIAEQTALRAKGDPFKSVRMTSREREVVELIAEGLSNKQIATRLHLAVDTVKSHVHNILEKLALHTRLEIATFRHGSAPPPSSSGPRSGAGG